MPNTALGRTNVAILTNKSGGALVLGDTVVIDVTTAASFTTTTTSGYSNGLIGVIIEPNGIASNALGLVAFDGYVSKVNLSGSASLGDLFKTHTVAGQAVRHAAPFQAGDCGIVLGTGTTPAALLFGKPHISASGVVGTDSIWDAKGDIVAATGADAAAKVTVGANGLKLVANSAASAGVQWGGAYACVIDQKASGTAGGTFTSGAWRTRDLNTEQYDAHGIVSVASNQLTLGEGTYRIHASVPAFYVNGHASRLYNVTGTALLLNGTGEVSDSTITTGVQTESTIAGMITLAGTTVIEVQHQCQTTRSTNGLGRASTFTVGNEVYTIVEIWKEI